MPVYDYVCTSCGRVTEVIHGINAEGPRFCPACGAEGTLRKGFSTPAVHFKGSGWAKKDRVSSATKASSSRSGADGKSDATSTAPTDGTGSSDERSGSTTTAPKEGASSADSPSGTGKGKDSRESKAEGSRDRTSNRSTSSSGTPDGGAG